MRTEETIPMLCYEHGKQYEIQVSEIHTCKQTRKHFDSLGIEELADSIRATGIINPVSVTLGPNGIELVAGERRLRAAKSIGMEVIPARFFDKDSDIIALVENLQRQSLSVMEEAEAVLEIKMGGGLKLKELSKCIGKPVSSLSELLSLTSLPEDIKIECRGNSQYCLDPLRKIARAGSVEKMRYEFKKYQRRLAGDTSSGRGKKRKQVEIVVAGLEHSLRQIIAIDPNDLDKDEVRMLFNRFDDLERLCRMKASQYRENPSGIGNNQMLLQADLAGGTDKGGNHE